MTPLLPLGCWAHHSETAQLRRMDSRNSSCHNTSAPSCRTQLAEGVSDRGLVLFMWAGNPYKTLKTMWIHLETLWSTNLDTVLPTKQLWLLASRLVYQRLLLMICDWFYVRNSQPDFFTLAVSSWMSVALLLRWEPLPSWFEPDRWLIPLWTHEYGDE